MKYTDEMVAALKDFADKYADEIPYEDVEAFTEEFNERFADANASHRSIAGKLRHMDYDLARKTTAASKYTPEMEETIRQMCADEDNLPSQEALAEALGVSCQSIGGKLISMGIYGVKKEHKASSDYERKFTPEDEATIIEMVNAPGDTYIEDIAEKLGKTVNQVRGRLAGMRIKGVLTRDKKANKKARIYTDELLASIKEDIDAGISLEDIAEKFNLNFVGLRSIAGKKGLIKKVEKAKFWTEEKVAELIEHIENGLTRKAVADAMNTTVAVVGKQAKKLGLEFAEE